MSIWASVKDWFWRRFLAPDDPFVFWFRDGRRRRAADPLEVDRVLVARLGDEWWVRVKEMTAPVPPGLVGEAEDRARADREKTRVEVLAAIDAAFGVSPLADGRGMSEVARLALLDGYCRFCALLMDMSRPFGTARSRASPSPGT